VSAQPRRGGILLRTSEGLAFLPASVVTSVAPVPPILRFAGAPDGVLGIAQEAGEILPVVEIGADRSALLVCSYLGEPLGLVGAEIVRAGLFESDPAAPDRLQHEGESVRVFDLSAIYARLQTMSWAARWASG